MKSITLAVLFIIGAGLSGCRYSAGQPEPENGQAVNPLIGDLSYVSRFGNAPGKEANEDLRIQTHLHFVEQILRQKDVSSLSPNLQTRRTHLLDLLHNYQAAGIFPRNYDIKERRAPCFIDKDGRICAVGYLIEQTAGRAAAETINDQYKYSELLAMNSPEVGNWIKESGLTREEAAMIQPTYGWYPPENNYISKDYGISSALWSGANLSLNAMNTVQMSRGTGSLAVPIIGMFSGAGQLLLGAAKYPSEQGSTTNESEKILSMVNMGLGTTTLVLSVWNFFADKKQVARRTTWNVYGFPTRGNQNGVALSYTYRF